ncbi:MAG: hypothetical protein Q8Q33_08515 [Chlamydiota bacterium]|nr:hypothetical protein [Chlamydiota bacterium]
MSYKFIFDTNALREDSVSKMKDAGLVEACVSGRFAFYFTPVLLTERSHFLLKGAIPGTARKPFQFLLSLRWQEFFNDFNGPEGIYTLELEGKLPSGYLFISHSQIRNNLTLILQGGELTQEAQLEIRRDTDRWLRQKQQNLIVYKKMREDINEHLRKNLSLKREGSKFSDFYNTNFEKMAIDKIKSSINSQMAKETLIEYWNKNKQRCPYFNKFIEGQLYQAWYAMATLTEPRIKSNDYEDIEHLVYLNSVDGIVSNDTGFMKSARQELFPDKEFFSVDEFVDKIRALAFHR